MKTLRLYGLMVFFCLAAWGLAPAGEFTLKCIDKEPPKELDESIRAVLDGKAIQLLEGDKPAFEFWFRREVPLQSPPPSLEKALEAVKQATLIGAVSVPSDRREYRDDDLYKGVYTMRFVLQPQDGNHLGTADFPYFVALVPAKLDTKLDGFTEYKPLVKASSRETVTDHPVILSLRPAASDEGQIPSLQHPAPEHKSIRVKLPAKAPGAEGQAALTFELVYYGKGKK